MCDPCLWEVEACMGTDSGCAWRACCKQCAGELAKLARQLEQAPYEMFLRLAKHWPIP